MQSNNGELGCVEFQSSHHWEAEGAKQKLTQVEYDTVCSNNRVSNQRGNYNFGNGLPSKKYIKYRMYANCWDIHIS